MLATPPGQLPLISYAYEDEVFVKRSSAPSFAKAPGDRNAAVSPTSGFGSLTYPAVARQSG